MSDAVENVIETLSRLDGVRGAIVVDAEAGVPVLASLSGGVEETALAAMSGALFERSADASRTAGYGGLSLLQLEAAEGHLLIVGAGPLLVAALTEPDARLGMIRAQLARAGKELADEA